MCLLSIRDASRCWIEEKSEWDFATLLLDLCSSLDQPASASTCLLYITEI